MAVEGVCQRSDAKLGRGCIARVQSKMDIFCKNFSVGSRNFIQIVCFEMYVIRNREKCTEIAGGWLKLDSTVCLVFFQNKLGAKTISALHIV